jgi:hypothetical protein
MLEDVFGPDVLAALSRVTPEGSLLGDLGSQLAEIELLFWGAYLTACREIGLAPTWVTKPCRSPNSSSNAAVPRAPRPKVWLNPTTTSCAPSVLDLLLRAPTLLRDLKLIGGERGNISGSDVPVGKGSGRGCENRERVAARRSVNGQHRTEEPGNSGQR